MLNTGIRNAMPCALALTMAICCGSVQAQSTAKRASIPPPPMGWSSWNSFSNAINSQITLDQAKAMISTGMAKAGYRNVNIDEGWWLGNRDDHGNIVVDPTAWPALAPGEHAGDMANIVRAIHHLGLKAGIYTDAGKDGCSTVGPDLGPSYPNTGSENHYDQDFLQFARWGFDYVKVDWCGGDKENLDPAVQYAEIARSIARAEAITGHKPYFSICNWGKNSPWTWAPNVGGVTADIWRTSGDIVAPIVADSPNSGRMASFAGVLSNFDKGIHPEAQHTGFYNDPDMMVVGMQGLTEEQNRVHMSLWAVSGAPLLVGADLTKLSSVTQAILTNPEVLAIDQDGLGLQAVKVAEAGKGLEVWTKPLATAGARAVLLLNRTAAAAPIPVHWSDLGLLESSTVTVKDVWAGKELGTGFGEVTVQVEAGDAVVLLICGSEAKQTTYKPVGVIGLGGGSQIVPLIKGRSLDFADVASRTPMTRIQITYSNPDTAARFAELRVNDRIATRVAFPPTGKYNALGMVTIQSLLDRAGAKNELSFSASGELGLGIESITLQ